MLARVGELFRTFTLVAKIVMGCGSLPNFYRVASRRFAADGTAASNSVAFSRDIIAEWCKHVIECGN